MSVPFKPDNFPTLSPYLTVIDIEASIAFYKSAFGFQTHGQPMMEGDKIVHAEMNRGEALIMFAAEGSFGSPTKAPKTLDIPSPIGLYVYVEDVNEFSKEAVKNGAEMIMEPTDQFWGDRMCRLRDPNGYQWTFATKVAEFDPSNMPTE